MTKFIVSWDLGATKCASAVVEYDEEKDQFYCLRQTRVEISDCDSLEQLVEQVEAGLGFSIKDADALCIGAAGHFDGEIIQLASGYPFPMNIAKIHKEKKWPPYCVIHDYALIVCATFTDYMNNPNNIAMIHVGKNDQYGRRVALGIGTGLGLKDGVLLANNDFWLGSNELGHIGLIEPPLVKSEYIERHHELSRFLRSKGVLDKDEPMTFEKILSGKGFVRLHQFVRGHCYQHEPEVVGAEVRAGNGEETLSIFAWYLGLLVGSIQLIFMPSGGIWIAGGVALKHPDAFERPEFMEGIHALPSYINIRKGFPIGLFAGKEHAFLGGAFYASRKVLK